MCSLVLKTDVLHIYVFGYGRLDVASYLSRLLSCGIFIVPYQDEALTSRNVPLFSIFRHIVFLQYLVYSIRFINIRKYIIK